MSTSPWMHLATKRAAWLLDPPLWIKVCMSRTVPMQIIPLPTPSDLLNEASIEPGPASISSTILAPWPCWSNEENEERLGRVVRGGRRSGRGIF